MKIIGKLLLSICVFGFTLIPSIATWAAFCGDQKFILSLLSKIFLIGMVGIVQLGLLVIFLVLLGFIWST